MGDPGDRGTPQAHTGGEAATARAAARAGSLMCVSTDAGTPFADIGAAGPSVWDLVRPGELLANLDTDDLPDEALDKADGLTPDIIGDLADTTGLPVVVKGGLPRQTGPVGARRPGRLTGHTGQSTVPSSPGSRLGSGVPGQ
ncbi:hypothetical protein [Phytomonospora endophytica]|uniref:Uncharacterized protein n=1 Tax=Phytomonospora endophytica TaxID=714109 RepID=A0A841G0F9_9ACTN|nr:hypothetical protein [Phytomonospora endophytica]MBB6039137.1 hypothetical protein [Phytomonospora endophytica]